MCGDCGVVVCGVKKNGGGRGGGGVRKRIQSEED